MLISTNSAMGRSNTPRALVTVTDDAVSSSNSSLSTPAAATWIQRSRSARSHTSLTAVEKKSHRNSASAPSIAWDSPATSVYRTVMRCSIGPICGGRESPAHSTARTGRSVFCRTLCLQGSRERGVGRSTLTKVGSDRRIVNNPSMLHYGHETPPRGPEDTMAHPRLIAPVLDGPAPQIGVGVVVPYDMALDREMWRWTPPGVSLFFTRTPYADIPVTVEMAEHVSDGTAVHDGVQDLRAVSPSAFAYACTSGSFVNGLAGERAIIATMHAAGARRAVTTSGAPPPHSLL